MVVAVGDAGARKAQIGDGVLVFLFVVPLIAGELCGHHTSHLSKAPLDCCCWQSCTLQRTRMLRGLSFPPVTEPMQSCACSRSNRCTHAPHTSAQAVAIHCSILAWHKFILPRRARGARCRRGRYNDWSNITSLTPRAHPCLHNRPTCACGW